MAAVLARRRILIALLLVALLAALAVGGASAWRLAQRASRPPPPPRQTDVAQIAGWMPVGYVARAYRVPAPVLFEALGVSAEGPRGRTLDDVAAETGRSSDEVVAIVRETVAAWQEAHPPPERGGPRPDGAPSDGPRPDGPRPDGPRPGEPRPDRQPRPPA
jgi:hypothetical protein